MNILKKLFSKQPPKNPIIEDLANNIFIAAIALGEGCLKAQGGDELPLFRVVSTICSGLINLVDRVVFIEMPNQRSQVMNQLVDVLARLNVEMFIDGRLNLANPMATMTSELNRGHLHLAQFTQFSSGDDESPKGTFMWEFGRLFAADLGRSDDPVIVMLGIELLTHANIQLKIKDEILRVKG